MELRDVNTVIWPSEVEALEVALNMIRPCNGTEQLDLCYPDDASQILDLANQCGIGEFKLAVINGKDPVYLDANKLDTTYIPQSNLIVANNNPCFSNSTGQIIYCYKMPESPRCFHLLNSSRGMDIFCGRLWRSWKGQQGLQVGNFGAGDTLVWA